MIFERLYTSELDLALNASDSQVLFTTARRKQAINDAEAEFAALTECYQRRSTLAVSCNTAEYVLSTISDFARISAQGLAEYHHTSSGGSSIARFTQLAGPDFERNDELWQNRFNIGWRQSTTPVDFPTGYYIRTDGGQTILGLIEPPDVGSSDTVRLIVPYVARPRGMTSSGDVPFTDSNSVSRTDLTEYHQGLVHYAAYKLLPLQGRLPEAQGQLQLFMGYVARYQGNSRPRGGQHVTVARSYLSEARRGRVTYDASLEHSIYRWRP